MMTKERTVALLGHPNVGKSVVFSRLTGISAVSSNYPGTTVEYQEGRVVHNGINLTIYDLPGTYGLTGVTEDEKVATRLLAEKNPDCVVVIADASRLEPSLVLAFQVIELGLPTVLLLNQMDIARKRYTIDVKKLESILKIPVVPSVALTGEGLDELVKLIAHDGGKTSDFRVAYDSHIEDIIKGLEDKVTTWPSANSRRGPVLKLLEGNEQFYHLFDESVKIKAEAEKRRFEEHHKEPIEVHMNRDRYGEAGRIISDVVSPIPRKMTRRERASELTMRPWPGIPVLLIVLLSVFLIMVVAGATIETVLVAVYKDATSGLFEDLAALIGGELGRSLANGLNLTLMSIVAIVIPYILLFYFLLAILEDTGYLPRVVILLDGIMQKIGLSGRSVIPMIIGTGCNVPAVLATRVMASRRERLILSTVIILAVPCGAQTVVILGTVGTYGTIYHVAAIYLILLALIIFASLMIHRMMRFEPIGLLIEVPELTMPVLQNVISKTYLRTKDFFFIAFPILLVTSLVLELLLNFELLDALVEPFSPLTTGLLGLPAVMVIALLFGILRKEMSLQLLVILFGTADLASVLTIDQMFVFALVMATYIPCVAAFSVMLKEFGPKDSIKVLLGSIVTSFALGGAANLVLGVI
ncbi:MAG: ferrous iron transport protein B [Methanomassiliicoccales archaeon]|nr:MAG: ferrous iron transport protein B [Methanomassiliicoccales archaeon]